MNYTLHQLNLLVTISETGNITRAAEKLNMTQPALSIQLKNLQQQFDIPLTEIIGRKLYMTEFGMELVKIARGILEEVDTINQKAKAFKGLIAGKVKFSVVSSGKYVLPYYLNEFLLKYPDAEIEMDVTNRNRVIESLIKNEIDFALVSHPIPGDDYEQEIIARNMLFLVAKPDLEEISKKKFNIKEMPFIMREEGSGTRLSMEKYFIKNNINTRVKLVLATNEAVKQAVMAGLGCSMVSIYSLKRELHQKDLVIIPQKGLPLINDWRLIWLKSKKLSPIAQTYRDFIRTYNKVIYQKYFGWVNEYK